MNNHDEMPESRGVQTARAISQIPIDPTLTEQALRDVRQSLLDSQRAARPRRFHAMRGALMAVAAGIVIVAMWWTFAILSPSMTIAQQLERAAEQSRDYKGWVHIRSTYPPPATRSSQPAVIVRGRESGISTVVNQPLLFRVVHLNRADGTSIMEMALPGNERMVQMRIPTRKLW